MYAIFEAKGKQWRAEQGATIKLPSLDAEPGDQVTFDEVLLAQDGDEVMVGRPSLEGASVVAEVTEHGKGDKIIVFKRKKRKGYRRKQGHRQPYTEVKIVDIELDGVSVAPAEEAEPEEAEAPEEAPPEPEEAAEEIDVTDAARELAEEYGIDLTGLEGTGKDGRILKSDVQAAVDELEAVIPEEIDITDAARELAEDYGIDVTAIEGTGKDGRILKSDVQGAIDERQEG